MGEKDQDKNSEELSALMDGEVSELELRRVLKNLQTDDQLGEKWQRYQLTSAVLKQQTQGNAAKWAEIDLSSRVSAAIGAEPALHVKSKPRKPMLKPFANVAVAASVSAAVILGWQNFGQAPVSGAGPAVASSASTPVAVPVTAAASNPFMAVSQGAFPGQAKYTPEGEIIRYSSSNDDRLNSYLLSHSSNAAMSTAAGVSPYAKAVTIKPAQPGPVKVNLEQ